MRYPAVVTKEGKNILAEFPTCPGCQTYAPPGRDIAHEAAEALELWLETHLQERKLPPRPPKTFKHWDGCCGSKEPGPEVKLKLR
jgi:predicted RNase H-like HicB family nuclease